MCSHYLSLCDARRLKQMFNAEMPSETLQADVWPGFQSLFIRRAQSNPTQREALSGSFGLIPHWATDTQISRHTYNARSETVASKPSFRDAWLRAQHCIIPAEAIYEPDWRSGKALPARISRADGRPMGIAGLWTSWSSPQGALLHSFTMLTINADHHPLMQHFHRPQDEKRMVVILPEARYDDWLHASSQHSRDFLTAYPAEDLHSTTPLPSNLSLF